MVPAQIRKVLMFCPFGLMVKSLSYLSAEPVIMLLGKKFSFFSDYSGSVERARGGGWVRGQYKATKPASTNHVVRKSTAPFMTAPDGRKSYLIKSPAAGDEILVESIFLSGLVSPFFSSPMVGCSRACGVFPVWLNPAVLPDC
jgi:hypothetical protein